MYLPSRSIFTYVPSSPCERANEIAPYGLLTLRRGSNFERGVDVALSLIRLGFVSSVRMGDVV